MTAYYNEFDPYAAEWLRNLIRHGLIAPGEVDDRSIADVQPIDLAGFDQCHFFAGIGGWSLAARLAGIPDDYPLWTGSCPCQPFSAAGKRKGVNDERHLWPVFRDLIRDCRPAVVAGEQVASKDGRLWLAGVRTDLEALGYAVGAADLCAAGVGAPHIRQRLWWLAHPLQPGRPERRPVAGNGPAAESGSVGGVADTDGRLADANSRQRQGLADGEGRQRDGQAAGWIESNGVVEPGGELGFWSRYHIVHCTDGKARRFEPGSFPLAHGVSSRVGRLRAYGNAINPHIAAEFLKAWLECQP